MNDKKTKRIEIKGRMSDGTLRGFDFYPVDAITGLEIFADYEFNDLMLAACLLVDMTSEDKEKEKIDPMAVVAIAAGFPLEWEDVKNLSKLMLAGATVDTEKPKTYTIGEDGIVNYALGDPAEQYLALSYALCANFPKYTTFFLAALGENTEKDSTQGDTQNQDGDDSDDRR